MTHDGASPEQGENCLPSWGKESGIHKCTSTFLITNQISGNLPIVELQLAQFILLWVRFHLAYFWNNLLSVTLNQLNDVNPHCAVILHCAGHVSANTRLHQLPPYVHVRIVM